MFVRDAERAALPNQRQYRRRRATVPAEPPAQQKRRPAQAGRPFHLSSGHPTPGYSFGPNAMHQPSGEITPDTNLQAFGASQFAQALHWLPSYGVDWYSTIAGAIFSCARALTAAAPTAAAPPTTANPDRSTCRRVA
jgi:hypothetical protein